MKQQVINIIKELAGNEYLYFDSPVQVKLSPHLPAMNIWGACASPSNELYIMDANQAWWDVDDINEHIINSLHQRLSVMKKLTA